MIDSEKLEDQMEILENVIHFVATELRSLPRSSESSNQALQVLLDDLYEVLDRHGYRGIIKVVGDVHPEFRDSGGGGWACDCDRGENFYLFKQ